jgi:hypothetical protein
MQFSSLDVLRFYFLVGGLPLTFLSVKRALKNKQTDVLVRFSVAASCLALFAICTIVLAAWHPQIHVYICLIGYLILSAILLMVGTVSVVSVVLSTMLIIVITAHAPQLWNTQDVNSPMFITGLTFMALATIFAAMGLRRGTIRIENL